MEPINLDAANRGENTETVDLFTLEGTTYTIPAKPRANVALKYLYNVRKHGEDHAASVLMEDLLGEEAYRALMEYEHLTMEDLNAVMLAAQRHLMGAIEEAGKADSGGS